MYISQAAAPVFPSALPSLPGVMADPGSLVVVAPRAKCCHPAQVLHIFRQGQANALEEACWPC